MLLIITVSVATSAQQISVQGGINVQGIQVGAIAQGLAITTASPLPNCTQGVPYFQEFNVSGGTAPYTWAVISGSIQPGLGFSAQGVLSGTCSNNSGTANFTVQVTDNSNPPQSVSAPFAQTANGAGAGLAIPNCPAPGTPPNCPPSPFATASFYQYAFLATGGTPPYAWNVTSGGLPTGLNLTTGGYLSGFPNGSQTQQITYNFTLTVTDSILNTATQAYTIIITPTLGAAQVALEPQHWVSGHMGGVNSSTGNPCAQGDTNCTWNLPVVCDNAHNCTHEQLGFGTNNHPATLAGLYAASCDWVALGQNRYMWVEVQLGPGLIHGTPLTGQEGGTDAGGAVYSMPVKYTGVDSVSGNGTRCQAPANDYPAGIWTQPGTCAPNPPCGLQLGEIVTQAVTGATAMITCVPGSSCYCPPNVLVNLGTCNYDPSGVLTQPNLQIDSITGSNQGNGATADGTHVWTGQTSGATFTPSGVPVANGFFRVTGACDFGGTNVPCNNLTDHIPCFISALDSAYIDNPLCTNDLPSMWQINADTPGNTGAGSIVLQEGFNTAISGVEITLSPGSNQSMGATLCSQWSVVSGPNQGPVNCNSGNVIIKMKCGVCVRDHYFLHGWDPGDPGQLAFAQTTNYPTVTQGGVTQYNCPSWGNNLNNAFPVAYPTTAPYFLQGNFAQFTGGCGDDLIFGVNATPAGPWVDEYFSITKIHLASSEAHGFQIGTGQNNTPAYPYPFGALSGPGKLAHFKVESGSIAVFEGTPVWLGLEIRDFRMGSNPKYRFLTASSGNAPQACASLPCATNIVGVGVPVTAPLYGCNQGYWQDATHFGSGKFNNACPFGWAAKKCFEIKKAKLTMLDGGIFEFMYPDGQTGECLDVSPSNTSGGPNIGIMDLNYIPMVPSEDIRFTNAIMRNASGGMGYRARSGIQSNGGGTSQGANRTYVNNFLVYNMDVVQFGNGSGESAQKYGQGNQSETGVNWLANIATIDASGQRTLVGHVDPITPTNISNVTLSPPIPGCSGTHDCETYPGALVAQFNGQRQDPINNAPGLFLEGESYAYFTCNTPCPITDVNWIGTGGVGGILNSPNIDCRTMTTQTGGGSHCTVGGVIDPYAPTQLTGQYAPVCSPAGIAGTFPAGQPGVGDKELIVGRPCHNCGVGANLNCPDFGATGYGLASPYSTDEICHGTGPCGPTNVQFPSWAFGVHDVGPSDIVAVSGCTNTGLNTIVEPIVPNVYACAAGAVNLSQGNCTGHAYNTCAGTQNAGGLTLLYPGCSQANGGPAPYSSTTETCHFFNSAGWQKNFIVGHYALYSANLGKFNMTPFGYVSQSQQNQITNSIFYFGPNGAGFVCTSGGCASKEANQGAYLALDQASNSINNNLFMLPTAARASLYTALNAPGFKICNGGVGNPTPGNCTLFGFTSGNLGTPISTNCATTQTLDNGTNNVPICAGLTGYLSLGTWPAGDCTLSTFGSCPWASAPYGTFDYHLFNLCATCYLGGKNFFTYLATDGVQLGPCIGSGASCANQANTFNVISIDSAMTRAKYICTGACGTGPWPD